MTLADVLIGILAVNSLVELLRHAHFLEEARLYFSTTPFWHSRMLRCGFCSSYHVALWLVVPPLLLHGLFPQSLLILLTYWLVIAAALARAAQLLNDLFHEHHRSPNRKSNESKTET